MILRDDQGKISGKILVTASKRKRLSCLKIPGMRLAARRFCLALR